MSEETTMDIIKGMVQEIGKNSAKQKSAKRHRAGNKVGKKTLKILTVQTDVEVVDSPVENKKQVLKAVKEENTSTDLSEIDRGKKEIVKNVCPNSKSKAKKKLVGKKKLGTKDMHKKESQRNLVNGKQSNEVNGECIMENKHYS